jgi:hypothetical protein
MRERDPDYMKISELPRIAVNGNFPEASQLAMEESWRATTTPFGHARKARYVSIINFV